MLSTMLPGCHRHGAERIATPVAVTITDRPPPDLLVCPAPPVGVPRAVDADIPAPARAALIRLALAYRQATDQLTRLINWTDPTACPVGGGLPTQPNPPLDLLPPAAR
jgi:hypothetical protein